MRTPAAGHVYFSRTVAVLTVMALFALPTFARPLRLFVVGNSFSANATHYLPQLAQQGGHELVIGKAETGSCSLERHWTALKADLADPHDPKAKFTVTNLCAKSWGRTTGISSRSNNTRGFPGTLRPTARSRRNCTALYTDSNPRRKSSCTRPGLPG